MKNNTVLNLCAVACLLMGAGVTNASPANNAWLEVHVKDRHSEKPLPDAAVCLGTTGVLDQLGAKRTNENGIVRFDDLTRTSLQLTVSKSGYQGAKRLIEPLYESRILELKIVTGGGGPDCAAPVRVQSSEITSPSLFIRSVSVERGEHSDGMQVLVTVVPNAAANQVRISENEDFSGATWIELSTPIAVELSSGEGPKRLYAQVRRHSGTEGASLDMVSPIKQVYYNPR